MVKAMQAYRKATELVPDRATNGEAAFWVGVTLADSGRVEEAIPYLVRAQKQDARWARLLPRLPASGLLPDDAKLIRRLVEQMQGE
jgi:tetratricopeptide (TPR) repeat protein